MSFDTRVARLIRRHGPPQPILVTIAGCPSGQGDDEGLIVGGDATWGGESYWRGDDETVEAFHDRLLTLAAGLSAPTVFIGVGPSRRKGDSPNLSAADEGDSQSAL